MAFTFCTHAHSHVPFRSLYPRHRGLGILASPQLISISPPAAMTPQPPCDISGLSEKKPSLIEHEHLSLTMSTQGWHIDSPPSVQSSAAALLIISVRTLFFFFISADCNAQIIHRASKAIIDTHLQSHIWLLSPF